MHIALYQQSFGANGCIVFRSNFEVLVAVFGSVQSGTDRHQLFVDTDWLRFRSKILSMLPQNIDTHRHNIPASHTRRQLLFSQ